MILVQKSDFVGEVKLARSINTDPVIDYYISKYEAKYIRQILGVELGNLLIAYVQGSSNPPDARFDAIIDPFQEQEDCGEIHESEGLKYALVRMIYYHFITKEQVSHSQTGGVLGVSETSNTLSPKETARMGEARWNEMLDTIEAIQWKCNNDSATYPEYLGVSIPAQYSSFL